MAEVDRIDIVTTKEDSNREKSLFLLLVNFETGNNTKTR